MGFFEKVGHAIHEFFKQKDISRGLGIIEANPKEVLEDVGKTVDAVSATTESVASVASSVAAVATSDNDAMVEMHKEISTQGSFLTNNVRPFIALISFGLLIAGDFHYIPQVDWASTVVIGYMGLRTVDKLGQVFSAASAIKSIFGKK